MTQACILAIESSCDDTSVAVIRDGNILSNVTASQKVHELYGGVIPELASRAHMEHIVPCCHAALVQSNTRLQDLNAVAITRGPGLIGSLIVGLSYAKGLCQSLNIPLIEVNHMQAHVLSACIDDPKPKFPFLCLTVSGGHSQIVLVRDFLDMEVIGKTIDDAAGEAFDKSGKLLGLPYPAGPWIDKYAKEGKRSFSFSKPHIKDFDYSFSGIKTSILYFLRDQLALNPNFIKDNIADLCCSIQYSIIDILLDKLIKAAAFYNINQIAISGGVSANSGLRQAVTDLSKEKSWDVYIPKFEYCTDNAGMIAIAAYYKFLKSEFADLDISPLARWKI